MSRWWSDSWHFTLTPDGVTVGRAPRRLGSGAAGRPNVVDMVPVTAGGAEPWSATLAVLADVLAGIAKRGERRAPATVILSNHFVRYALVPWSELIDGEDEGIALSRHHLRETYGAAAERWDLRVAPDDGGAARLVSAVEPELLEELRRLFDASPLRLASIQPHLMAACNEHRRRLSAADTWLALVEPASLCLALLHGQRFAGLRQARLGEAWQADLLTTLERESLLAEPAAAVKHVFVIAGAGVAKPPPEPDSPWALEWLEAPAAGSRPPAPAGG